MSRSHLLKNAETNFRKAAALIEDEVEEGIIRKLAHAKSRLELTLTPRLEDGRIHVVYSYFVEQGKSMKHVALNEAWVRGNESATPRKDRF